MKKPHPLDGKLKIIIARAVMRALIKSKGNRSWAARRLGISKRGIRLIMNRYPEILKAFPHKINKHKSKTLNIIAAKVQP